MGALQIKTEPVSAIQSGYRRLFQRGGHGGHLEEKNAAVGNGSVSIAIRAGLRQKILRGAGKNFVKKGTMRAHVEAESGRRKILTKTRARERLNTKAPTDG